MKTFALGEDSLSLENILAFDQQQLKIVFTTSARERMHANAATLKRIVSSDQVCYGVNTGFGALANKKIEKDQLANLQLNLVRSHACGVGDPLPTRTVRRMMLLKAHSLALGYSGARPKLVDTLIAFIEQSVFPVIPCQGSVAASGDLAPLAHLTLALIGEGEATHDEKTLCNDDVLAQAKCEKLVLEPKEGLALLNGTQATLAIALGALETCENLFATSVIAGALTVDALAGSYCPFDDRIHQARNQRGQIAVARTFRKLLTESSLHKSHANCDRVQDPYALRCMPQVLGGVLDALHHAEEVLQRECDAVTDNPLVFDDCVISAGNFHAAPLGYVCDYLAIVMTDLCSMSERRVELYCRGVNSKLNLFLTQEPGLESGIMIAHVTAAALTSENKTLAHPASVDTIPTSAGQEDHVSMALWGARKLKMISNNTARVLAIELISAQRALNSLAPLETTQVLGPITEYLSRLLVMSPGDQRLDKVIEKTALAIHQGKFATRLTGTEHLHLRTLV